MHRGDIKATTDQARSEAALELGAALEKIKAWFTMKPEELEKLKAAVKPFQPRNRHEKRRAEALARRR
jgi:hypothetical protein